jgi:hypothetical protein
VLLLLLLYLLLSKAGSSCCCWQQLSCILQYLLPPELLQSEPHMMHVRVWIGVAQLAALHQQ